jgi:PAS domain S-box-containing protein
MNSSIRILYLEDSPVDVELSQAVLGKDGLKCEVTVVDTREDYVAALEAGGYDLILADYQLPSFDGMAALEIAREKSPELPFIFVSGAMGEEIATESLKRGATDYVLKERLARLPGSMRRALIEAEERRRLKQVERRLREQAEMLDLAQDAIFAWEMGGAISYWNRAAEEIYGYTQEEAIGRVTHELLETQAVGGVNALLDLLRLSGRWEGELRHRTKGGREIIVDSRLALIELNGQRVVLESNRDITERKWVERERERLLESENAARREAEHANRAKDEFLALLSHELRTPLTPMLGWTRILRKRQVRQEDYDSALEKLERAVEAEIKLVGDLLDVSRIITGKMTLNLQTLDLRATVKAAVEMALSSAEAKEIDLVIETGEEEAPVAGDPDRLQQVVSNLISNAIKFTPPGGRVETLMERAGGRVRLIVKDTGRGISPEFLPHIFERFRQADSSVTRAHDGLGLGLSIARRLVELHGGNISAESGGEGRGSTLTVEIPLAINRREPSDYARQIASGDGHVREFDAGGLEGARILMVDDDANTREMMRVMLEQFGADVVTASSAGEALSELRPGRYDAVLADIGMAEVNGYEFIARVRALGPEKGGDVPAIAITGYAEKEDRLHAITSGFQNHLSKPIEPEKLVDAIATLISGGEQVPTPA